jgi:hypothetical protein
MQSRIAVSNLRPSVIGGKMLSEENNNFISKYGFIFWQNSFILPHKGEK